MPLPPDQICERARQARDPRFDGRFYIGVLTTGIYCRPVCPARMPARDNVRFYPTAAAAQDAGFRPCLRCRPERAAPAHSGGSPVVARAVKRINEGALDDASVAALAAEVGVSARHLDRLFHAELGTSPLGLAQTRRLHLAKRLIDETGLPFADVAMAAGFGSVRRFNEAVRRTWQRSPRELRRLHGGRSRQAGPLSLLLPVRAPFDAGFLLDFLGRRALPGLEEVSDGCYTRHLEQGLARLDTRVAGGVRLTLEGADPAGLGGVLERARRLLDLGTDSRVVDDHLAADPLLAPLVAAGGGVRLPGAWDPFELAVRAICGQQVSVAGAITVTRRLCAAFGEPLPRGGHAFPRAAVLAAEDVAALALMPGARAQAIRALARAVVEGSLALDPAADPEALRAALVALPGIGPWTAHYISMRALGDPDAFPDGDLVVRQRAGLSGRALRERGEAWRPWRAYAVMYLWRGNQ